MGRERKGCTWCVENRTLESFKMWMRYFYCIFIWYEFWFWPDELKLPYDVVGNQRSLLHKAPFWSASIILYVIELTEIICAGGRQLTMVPAWYILGIYVALYSQQWAGFWVKLGLNIWMDISVVWT